MAYPELKKKAILLRKKGYSYNLISEQVGVSKSTLHYWLADVPYTPNKEVVDRIGKARAKSGEVKAALKRESFSKARQFALADIGKMSKRDLFMLGLGVYIGEGEKNEVIGVINSDPRIIVLMIRWFTEVCGLKTENFTLAIHLYPDNNIPACMQYWSDVTGVPVSQFGKTQIDNRVGKKLGKRSKLRYGTAHLRVKSLGEKQLGVFLSRRIKAWMDIVLE